MKRVMCHVSCVKKKSGFTLMELLIVIAIIGILLSIAIASYLSTQKKTRDTRRINDMKAIQNAWELYFADNSGTYPTDCISFSVTPTPGVMSGSYMPGGIPADPKSGTLYTDAASMSKCSSITYCFCASMEYVTSGNATKNCDNNTVPDGTGIYCVKQVQ